MKNKGDRAPKSWVRCYFSRFLFTAHLNIYPTRLRGVYVNVSKYFLRRHVDDAQAHTREIREGEEMQSMRKIEILNLNIMRCDAPISSC